MPAIIQNSTEINDSLGLTLNGEELSTRALVHVPQAERYLRNRVSDSVYSAAQTAGTGADYEALKQAEAMLAVSYALPYVNMRLTETGGLSKVIGMADMDSREELLTFNQIKMIQKELVSQANELTQHLIPTSEDPENVQAGGLGLMAIKGEDDWLS
jgi:hypothetical protein